MNTSDRQFDVVVIGSGPGGEGAAMQLAKSGRKVIMIEKHDSIGDRKSTRLNSSHQI